MIPKPAQYLLRFDDLCPTMDRAHWEQFLPLIQEFGIRPILAVIPDNQDYKLHFSPPDPEFWAKMRGLQANGATIALHGYRHLCQSEGSSLLPLHHKTEFAGVAADTQQQWIHEGLTILRDQGLKPKIWVAPRHGFDRATLRALRKEGITLLSDGFARVPFRHGGLTWIPQQLWGPVDKSKGLWTICVHANSASHAQIEQLRAFLAQHSPQFTSVERVETEFTPSHLGLFERIHQSLALTRYQIRRKRARRAH